jgi:hypothetical protein
MAINDQFARIGVIERNAIESRFIVLYPDLSWIVSLPQMLLVRAYLPTSQPERIARGRDGGQAKGPDESGRTR